MSPDPAISRPTSDRRRGAAGLAVAVALLFAGVARAQQTVDFLEPLSFPIGGMPYDLLVLDLDGNGTLDLLTTNFDAGTISVLLGDGHGDFLPLDDQIASSAPSQVATGYFNDDEFLDLVISEGEGDWVNIMLGNGDGTFQSPRQSPCSHDPAGVVVADMNHDDRADIVVSIASESGGEVNVLLGNGDGTFSFDPVEHVRRLMGPSYGIKVGRLDGDDNLDVAAVTTDGQLAILLGDGTGHLSRPVSQPTGMQPLRLALADLDGDGPLDIITADSGSDQLTLFRGDGLGAAALVGSTAVGQAPQAVAIRDMDGDTLLDAITANTTSGDLSLVPGRPGGVFGTARHFVSPLRPFAVGSGDFDGDGHLDLVSANAASFGSELVVLLARPGGFTAAESLLPGSTVRDLSPGDLTGDGLADLLVASANDGTIALLAARAGGGFESPRTIATGIDASFVRSADVDGDGRLDVLACDQEQPDLHVLLARPDGSFAAPQQSELPGPAIAIAIGDLDRDGLPDVVATGRSGLSVGVLFSNGDGTFTVAPTLPLSGEAAGVALGDFDGDGRLDIAAGNVRTGSITIFRGAGSRQFLPPEPVETGLGPFAVAAADIDGDGFDDLAALTSGGRQVRLLFGSANATFTPLAGPPASGSAIALRDVTGDLRPDILVADQIGNAITIAPTREQRGIGAPRSYVLGLRPNIVASADFDGDGRYDVVAHGNGSWVLTNQAGPAVLRGDGNGDGQRSAADLVALARGRLLGEPQSVERAARLAGATAGIDANGDAQVDRFDLTVLCARIFGG
ncbi:MAG TPA: FG-GAP-like repeat-containing protein [Candidatus Dormibacteraeota bacterium]|nr:FG-GAP-like repeat-containing protein [Candidatus Dormibacteraeota bacterium]